MTFVLRASGIEPMLIGELSYPVDSRYEGIYEVSSCGQVRRLHKDKRSSPFKILKLDTLRGYKKVHLYKNGSGKSFQVHRLVAEAFIPNPDNLPQVNHIDEDHSNNYVENLEWCDRKYNMRYGTAIKRSREKANKKVIRCDKEWNELKIYNSVEETREDGFEPKHVSDCALGKRKTHGGFKWKYVNE